MSIKLLLLSISAVVLAFIAGFLVANSINRSEINSLRAELENAKSTQEPKDDDEGTLSKEEIQKKIGEADSNPTNLDYQKKLGIALERYGSIKNDPAIVVEAARLLDRAAKLSPGDGEIVVWQGNAAFDIGYINKDNDALSRARAFYEAALTRQPDDVDTQTDLGLTYFLQNPPDDEKAIVEFKRSLALDAKHQKTLEFIIQSYVRLQNHEEAERYLTKLREAHPDSQSLAGLTEQVEGQNKLAAK